MTDLRALAEAATPGPWRAGPPNTKRPGTRYSGRRTVGVNDPHWWFVVEGDNANADAAYIAACSPDVILALLSERQAAVEALAAAYKWVRQHPSTQGDWACFECHSDSDMLIEGFRCVPHRAATPEPPAREVGDE